MTNALIIASNLDLVISDGFETGLPGRRCQMNDLSICTDALSI